MTTQAQIDRIEVSQVLGASQGHSSILVTNHGPTIEDAILEITGIGNRPILRFPTLVTDVPTLISFSAFAEYDITISINGLEVAKRQTGTPEFYFYGMFDKDHRYKITILRTVRSGMDHHLPLKIGVLPSTTSPEYILKLDASQKTVIEEPYATVGKVVTITIGGIMTGAFIVEPTPLLT